MVVGGGIGKLPVVTFNAWLESAFEPLKAMVEGIQHALVGYDSDIEDLKKRLVELEKEPAPEPDPEEPEEPQEPEEPPPPPPPPGSFSDATHKFAPLVDPAFDPNSPTRRDGKPLTDTERFYYAAMMRGLMRSDPDKYTDEEMFASGDSYYLGRHGQVQQEMVFAALSRTGDAHLLDEFVGRWNLAFDALRPDWDAANLDDTYVREWAGASVKDGKWVLSGGKVPWSPHLKWLYGGTAGRAGAGTDLNNLQTIKPWAILTQYLWALEVNRGKASPAGYDYGAEADRWKPVLRGFIETYTSNTGESWERNYLGLDGGMLWETERSRAKPGQWPFFVRGEGHAIYNSMMLCFYCGLLGERGWPIPNWQAALTASDTLAEYIRTRLYVETVDSEDRPALLARGGGKASVINATYTNYLGFSLNHIRDVGRWDGLFTDEDLVKLSRSYVDMHRPDGTTKKNLACGVDRTGHGWDVSGGSDRSVHQQVINGFCVGMLWEEGSYLFDVGTTAQQSNFGNGYQDAKAHIIPSIQFVTEVDRSV